MSKPSPTLATLAALAALVALAAFAGTSSAAAAKRVAAGDYSAAPVVPVDQAYGVGVFSVVKSGGKRQIVRSDEFLGIFYPDDGECDAFDLPLGVEAIPISATGRFNLNERTPVEDTFVQVSWKGHWSRPGVVSGSITIKHGGCTSTRKWTGGKVG